VLYPFMIDFTTFQMNDIFAIIMYLNAFLNNSSTLYSQTQMSYIGVISKTNLHNNNRKQKYGESPQKQQTTKPENCVSYEIVTGFNARQQDFRPIRIIKFQQ